MMKKRTLPGIFLTLIMGLVLLAACINPTPHTDKDHPNLSNPNSPSGEQVTVFFSKSRGQKVVTEGVVRDVPISDKAEPLKFSVQELLKGPNDEESTQGFYSEIPKGTRLIGLTHQGNSLQLNLSKQFASGGGSNSMQGRLAELSKTILAAEKEKPVYVNIEGQQLEVLGGEGVMVHEPINKGGQDVQ